METIEKYIKPFISVTKDVFTRFCKTEVTSEKVFFISTKDIQEWDISGVIGLSGEAKGALAISMKDKTAFLISSKLTGETYNYINEEVTDCVGEIINIISGNIKKELEEEFKLKISLPSIIKGKAHSVIWPVEKSRIICILFDVFDGQKLSIAIAIEPVGEEK